MNTRTVALIAVLAAAGAAGIKAVTDGRNVMRHAPPTAVQLPVMGKMPSLDHGTTWINSPPLTRADLQGKVVLIDFCTYSCINWLRQLPYVRAWAEAYKAHGLVVIGVHSPEFGFEHDVDRVRRAVASMGIQYPIVVDNGHSIWRAFENEAWPALFFIDSQGQLRHRHYGEGAYPELEGLLQQLLADAGRAVSQPLVTVEPKGVEAGADWPNLRTPELYVGSGRTENFASSGGPRPGRRHVYSAPERLGLNHWALLGDWTMGREATVLNGAHGRMVVRFHARDLHMVMGPSASGARVRFRVLIDGHAPGAAHGLDVDREGYGTVNEHRLHQLIRQSGAIAERTFEIEFLDAGIETFSFTFG